jgi:uracil-DNA glycosylase
MNLQVEPGWKSILSSELKKNYFSDLKAMLVDRIDSGARVYPSPKNIFFAFNATPWDRVRVVLLGQDPYHSVEVIEGVSQPYAHGLAFSIPKTHRKIPPSLKNIFRELVSDLGSENFLVPDHGNLKGWADQGVLCLNATLSVEAGKPHAHKDIGWGIFTDFIIRRLSEEKKHLVFLLWGQFAKSKVSLIDTQKHLILSGAHPSPFSAGHGFFGGRYFSKTNDYLRAYGQAPIDWGQL